MIFKTPGFTALLLSLLSTTSGCWFDSPSYRETKIDNISNGELPATVNSTTIRMAVGGIATAHVQSYDSDDKKMDGALVSTNSAILLTEPLLGSDSDYAFVAVHVGHTKVNIFADGNHVKTIDVEVVQQ